MKRLLSLCLLLHFSATLALAIQSASAVHNWYFDFRSGETVDRVRGVKANEKNETLVIERAFGRYVGNDAFVLDSDVESDSGVHLISGRARWEQVGDHFEAEIRAGAAAYHGIIHTQPMRKLLASCGIVADRKEEPFRSWEKLPSRALLAIKWHREKTGPAWHWVVFARDESGFFVLDSKRGLRTNRRTDFGRMNPKWFIRLTEKSD